MCACVCFCLRTDFPVKQIQKSKYQVGSGNETIEFRSFLPSACRRRRAQHSSVAHIDPHMHITDTQRTAEAKPSLPSCVCLGVEVSGDKQKTKLPVPRIYSLLSKRQTAHF